MIYASIFVHIVFEMHELRKNKQKRKKLGSLPCVTQQRESPLPCADTVDARRSKKKIALLLEM
jgi:hypothetical protein